MRTCTRSQFAAGAVAALFAVVASVGTGRPASADSPIDQARTRIAALKREVKRQAAKVKRDAERVGGVALVVNRVVSGASTTLPPSPPAPAGAGLLVSSHAVNRKTIVLVDVTRRTPANRSQPERPERTLPTTVWVPADADPATPLPLVLLAHGLGGEPANYRTLGEALASTGFVVAAPAFPLSGKDTPGGASLLDEPNQPGDLRFVADQLLAGALVGVTVNPDRIAAVGHSLGAVTVLDLVANNCCRDSRIKAAVIVGGTMNPLALNGYFGGPALPLLFLHGDNDATVPYVAGATAYAVAKRPKWFVTVKGGDHAFGLAGRTDGRTVVGPLYASAMGTFLDQFLGQRADGMDRLNALLASHTDLLRLDAEV